MANRRIQWPEEDYRELEDGIRDLVKSLHLLGIRTLASCEGHIRTSPIYVGVLPWPWIIILVTREELDDLTQRINSWNNSNFTKRWTLSQKRVHGSFTPEYIKSEIIRDNPGNSVTALCPKGENLRLDSNVLSASQEQANELSCFLQESST